MRALSLFYLLTYLFNQINVGLSKQTGSNESYGDGIYLA